MREQKPKNMITFTPQQKKEDAEQEYVEAIYRFREAEKTQSSDYDAAKRNMLYLEAKLIGIRGSIYRGMGYELFDRKQPAPLPTGCPKPAWI